MSQIKRSQPALVISAQAWLKLQCVARLGDTEVGGFGISSRENPLYVEDIVMVRQVCTSVSVAFDDEAVADFFDEQVDEGREPAQFGRIWIHSHPGASAQPSWMDEGTFARAFGACDWAAMVIVARDGETYCLLRLTQGPLSLEQVIPVTVDYEGLTGMAWRPGSWKAEYEATVIQAPEFGSWPEGLVLFDDAMDDWEEVLDAD
jgi:proteasome lid subunit RPN8/RPN11